MMSCLVGVDGLEPSTSSLSGKRSNRAELYPQGARSTRARRKGYRNCDAAANWPPRCYSVSRSVTSTPPTRCAVRLYTTEPTVEKAVIRNTLSTPSRAV